MFLIVDSKGDVRGLYAEAIDLAVLGAVFIRRASHVEPDDDGLWWADLAPVHGPRLGPFRCRSAALHAESHWLEAFLSSPNRNLKGENHDSTNTSASSDPANDLASIATAG
jgi:hypothetical protein